MTKVLNLYAGIGGNRKLWGDETKVTAIELEPKIFTKISHPLRGSDSNRQPID